MLAMQALYHLSTPLTLFASVTFEIGSCFMLASLDHDLPIYASQVAGMTGTYHQAQL
jgi:uncharacterized membrane protein YccC